MPAATNSNSKKRKEKKSVFEGNVYIQATFNNTIVTITDLRGNAISWASSGGLGFRGAKKSTPFAAQSVAETAVQRAAGYGLREVHV
ncbi:MAG: 30S ribosomal protein S11, partial [Treponema sp.]|nr:30S ribosomal protein S11 [Treponema sp.]